MVKELIHDPIFLSLKSEKAAKEDLQVAEDLLDTLIAHKEGCVGMAANMIGVCKRIIAFDNDGTYMVKLTSSGPVLYKAKRLGKKGRPIEVYKFRSMYADADERLERLLREKTEFAREFKCNFKLRNDPRVTPLGKFLRRTSLDELPQLLNVLKGEMSLVGPRPIVDQEVKYYAGNYEVFSSVKPGITGLWQTSGRSDSSYDERVGFDVYYVLNWSPWMDIWILIRTAFCVVTMKGAY